MSAALTQLPAGWRLTRLDRVAGTATSNVDKHSVEGQLPVRLCNYVDVYKNDSITGSLTFMTATATSEQVDRFRLKVGDTLITKDSETADDIGVPAFVELEAEDLVCGYHLAIVRPKPPLADARYLYWTLASDYAAQQWAVVATGVTRVGIKRSDMGRLRVAVPSLNEQRAIADYLDRETAQIDTLIAEQQRLIGLLHERRQSAVDSALLTGAPVVPVRRLADVVDCAHVTAEFVDNDVRFPVASIRECQGRVVDLSGCKYTTSHFFDLLRNGGRAPKSGDLLFIRNVSVGLVSEVRDEHPEFAMGQETVLLRRFDGTEPAFLRWALTSSLVRGELERAMVGSTFRRVNVSQIRALPVPSPPLDEQRRIVAELDEVTAKIDTLIAEAERFIELAKERRSALITAAVTGQIDIPGVE